MGIGRTEDWGTPFNPVGRQPRQDVWDPIRVTLLGQRSIRPHTQAGHMTAIDQTRPGCKKVLAKRGPSTHGLSAAKPISCDANAMGFATLNPSYMLFSRSSRSRPRRFT